MHIAVVGTVAFSVMCCFSVENERDTVYLHCQFVLFNYELVRIN